MDKQESWLHDMHLPTEERDEEIISLLASDFPRVVWNAFYRGDALTITLEFVLPVNSRIDESIDGGNSGRGVLYTTRGAFSIERQEVDIFRKLDALPAFIRSVARNAVINRLTEWLHVADILDYERANYAVREGPGHGYPLHGRVA